MLEPGGEESLSLPVGACSVEVADARFVRSVEDSARVPLHCLDLGPARQVVVVADVDVPGAAERRQAESEAAHRQAGPAK
jgi:hypothetical protein